MPTPENDATATPPVTTNNMPRHNVPNLTSELIRSGFDRQALVNTILRSAKGTKIATQPVHKRQDAEWQKYVV